MPGADLCGASEADRRAHFARHRFGEIGRALLIFLDDAVQQVEALFARRLRPAFQRFARRGDGIVDVGGGAEDDRRGGFFGRRVDHVVRLAALAVDPLAADVILLEVRCGVAHCVSPNRRV